MQDARLNSVFDRIEAALARIETAAAHPPIGSEGGWNAQRRLKKRVRQTLANLDLLIAEIDR